MADVTTHKTKNRVEVLLDGEPIHTARSEAEAEAVAQWVAFQVDQGTGAADLERMLRGEAPKKATGYSGGLVIEVDEVDEAPARSKRAKPNRKAKAAPPDLSILEGRVTKVKKAIEDGEGDEWLDDLLQAEEDGKARKTVLGAIEARQAELG